MYLLSGIRVVRGPDWKYGDQDGGEGHAGTVIGLSDPDSTRPPGLSKLVNVCWDSGFKGQYRSGPKGSYDLRIVSNGALGVKHHNIPCGEDDCWVQEIRGIRWLCTDCLINLCTNCFLKKIPHNKDHHKFRRYEESLNTGSLNSTVVNNGADGRIALMGIYPGALVIQGPYWVDGGEGDKRVGVVIQNPKEDVSGEIRVQWLQTKECTLHQRLDSGKNMLSIKEAGVGGYYRPETLPLLDTSVFIGNENSLIRPLFSVGDIVLIQEQSREKKWTGSTGIVERIISSNKGFPVVYNVKLRGRNHCIHLNENDLKKINKFSVGDCIQFRKGETTIKNIEKAFGISMNIYRIKMLNAAIGHVSAIDQVSPAERVHIHFNNQKISEWLPMDQSLSSAWMELCKPTSVIKSSLDVEIEDFVRNSTASSVQFFFRAVHSGNLPAVKTLYSHYKMDVDALENVNNGMSALHVASKNGYFDLVEWLLIEAKANLEVQDNNGFRAIHYAVKSCELKVLEILIERGANLDSQTNFGKAVLHFAVSSVWTDGICLLLKGGCDLNIQNIPGDTPLHSSILGIATAPPAPASIILILASSGRINWKLTNKKGFNVLQVAVKMENLKAIEYIMDYENHNLVMELMPNTESTVLHYACTQQNFQIVKLLLNHRNTDANKLLEAKNEKGMTALWISCEKKNPALVELLVEAGANLKTVDSEERTAIILAASSSAGAVVPTEELSPKIFKLYETIRHKTTPKDAILLSLLAYLVDKGCCWDACTLSGRKACHILLDDGYLPIDIRELQARSDAKKGIHASGGMDGCVGQQGQCTQPTALQLTCPHKPTYKSCAKCILKNAFENFKHDCEEETVGPISMRLEASPSNPILEDSKLNIIDEEATSIIFEEIDGSSGLTLVEDSTPNGFILDRFGFKFDWTGCLKEGEMDYRCNKPCPALKEKRCTAVAQKILQKNGAFMIRLVSPKHNHPIGKRKLDGETGPLGPSAGKKARRTWD